jgi:branched-chain amino acid transport system substrate-binding protein
MRRNVPLIAATAGLALMLAACGSDSGDNGPTGSSEPFHVVALGGIGAQGVLANNAATSVLSTQASAAYVNAHGGINGRQVVVEVIDDKADPTTAVTKLREYIAKTKPDLVVNSGPSTVANATLPILNDEGILSFNIGPTADSANPSKFPLNFDLSAGPTEYLKGFVTYLKSQNFTSVGILHGSSAYGESFGKLFAQGLPQAGVTVTANEVYDVAALDMTAQIDKVRASNPQALILDAYGAPLGYILKNIDKLAWNVPIVANNSVAATGIISTPQPDGLLGTSLVSNVVMEVYKSTKHSADATGVNEAVQQMKALGTIKSTLINAYNYDSLLLVQAAAAKAKSTEATALAKALEDPSVQQSAKTVIIGLYGFTTSSHTPNVTGEEFVFVKPSAIQDGQYS